MLADTRQFRPTLGSTSRRAFTLLEVALAVAIGALVMLGALTLLSSIQKSESMLSNRADDSGELQRLRLVFQRTFSTMLVSQSTVVNRQPAVATATPAEGGSQQTPSQPIDDTPPRVLLDVDDRYASATNAVMTMKRENGEIVQSIPQKLEVVLIDPPVPTTAIDVFAAAKAIKRDTGRMGFLDRRRMTGEGQDANYDNAPGIDLSEALAKSDGSTEEESDEGTVRAIRGVFELRVPEPVAGQRIDPRAKPTYELWWVPVAARRTVEEIREMTRTQRRIEAIAAGDPFMIARNITFLRIRMFDDRAKKSVYSAIYQKDLPAYVEVDVETKSGMRGEWLFEVGWAIGPETGKQAELARNAQRTRLENAAGADGKPGSGGTGGTGGAASAGGLGSGAGLDGGAPGVKGGKSGGGKSGGGKSGGK